MDLVVGLLIGLSLGIGLIILFDYQFDILSKPIECKCECKVTHINKTVCKNYDFNENNKIQIIRGNIT